MDSVINFPRKEKVKILSLGAESVGRFAFYDNGDIFISENFGDIFDEKNLNKFAKSVLAYVKNKRPDLVLTDLHPFYNSTALGEEISQKLGIPHVKVQHHIAHIFSALGDYLLNIQYPISKIKNRQFQIPNSKFLIPEIFIGIAADGTGYGFDGNIWGGEAFQVKSEKLKVKSYNSKLKISKSQNLIIERIGSLEEQTMIGGDLAVKEPARMLIAILYKIKNQNAKIKMTNKNSKIIKTKSDIYNFAKKYYTRNEFELLYNQLEQGFNCQETTSAGRVLDAASVLLGFAGNERNYKHEAIKTLEKNSSIAYDIKPLISVEKRNVPERKNQKSKIRNLPPARLGTANQDAKFILQTTPLFEYLIKNIHEDKKRLAATAQLYIAKGFYEIIKKLSSVNYQLRITNYKLPNTFFAGGMANNKIMSSYLKNKGVYLSKKIPCGDEGIAFGQIIYQLLNRFLLR